uniref:Apoptosis-inducing factor 3 n=2 Tax=Lygus hesperus TaxID=30085 RepID=A0A0A9WCY1_LYGHE
MGLTNCKDRSNGEFVEGIVCKASDIPENGMQVVNLDSEENKILVVKQNGQICAMGTKCSHYGAPLVNGALGNGRVRCPWHGACFNIKTGDIEDFPGLDSVPTYQVEVTPSGDVKVKARKSDLTAQKRLKQMAKRDPNNNNTFVIVGSGAAGLVCAETLRQEGFSGKVVLVTAEKYLPYDRVKLSKFLDSTADKIQLRPAAFYKEHGIETMTECPATGLDTEAKKLKLSNGDHLSYSSIFIATGSIPRRPDLPGVNLTNIFTLRSLDDAHSINNALSTDSEVVVYGSSFIGMEAAAYCNGKVKKVTVVGRSAVPFAESLGQDLGGRIGKLFTDKGVVLKMNTTIKCFKGDGEVSSIELSDGSTMAANVVILGLGSTFATDFLKESTVKLTPKGTVPVNKFLETNCPGVYAGGDIAEAPVFSLGDKQQQIGHWGLAHYHGRIAALNMMSHSTPLKSVPFFWTMLFGTSFRYAGYGAGYTDIVSGGDLEALKYVCYYCKDDKVIAVATVGTDPIAAQFAELLNCGGSLSKMRVSKEPLDWYKR